jgi:hypothetical protein
VAQPTTAGPQESGFVRGLNLLDATMVVMGVMIGSGIFIVTADMSRFTNSPRWLLATWVLTGALTTGFPKVAKGPGLFENRTSDSK